ncbi:MAG TPA: glycosyltransferase family 39 protein [Solirubrobacterales bacterium]|nr:glycosyltransferase family 39 protein [Solirubrobacterales bacterium]
MQNSAATVPAAPGAAEALASPREEAPARRWAIVAAVAGLTAAGAAIRFAPLGVQSFHHDEVITVMRVIPGSFGHMLHEVKASESNPPLYYVLAWGWARAFGRDEWGIRSLSALLGTLTVALGYPIGRQLASRRVGLILAGLLAFNPMLIWYSQEARSYALLVFFGALSFLFFLRALDSRGRSRELALWAIASALALGSHYFAFFAVGIEAAWLAVALRHRWKAVLPALAAVGAAGAALLPLIAAQTNPNHIGWIEESALGERFFQTGVSFLIGETGHVIAEPPRVHYAVLPALGVALAALALLALGTRRERRGAAIGLVVGLGVLALAGAAALAGKDYVVERNLLPALVPLAAVVALGLGASRARFAGMLVGVALCAYWLAFDVYVTQTPNLQRPDYRGVATALGPARVPRAIVSWRLAGDPLRWYLGDGALRWYGGGEAVREVDLVGKRNVAERPANLPGAFHLAAVLRINRLTVARYVSSKPVLLWMHELDALQTGYATNTIVLDGPPAVRRTLGEHARTAPSHALAARRAEEAVRG